ncbi:alkyl hydroperoxide reductase/ Thiol specific antioxidant/ Mal allergen [Paludibacter propionicigenes WB4]|uniref:Alkyl hydroperoxide reductase/ Thiol specific antioxidant/ Mal allergen n=1 Tax=Paludibacter propionicigenes (strain DSM 17365 / JCM 13257 / WB4) TaxID=694427 RepID=E4T3E2_PALPW|nr:thioredoxin-like domain-containing protein [Paludibacter propionicigenes]ADQ79236.1 alkyl hydroperoxide reductase/ Thiol specific antioxidant/ Mal allergen [Paludibacter propionicigenes WB4]
MKFKILVISLLAVVFQLNAQTRDITITVHIRGVWNSKISLLALSGPNAGKPIAELSPVKSNESAIVTVAKDQLPGEFVIRFDYKDKETSTPYPSEKHIFAYSQNLELFVNPPFCNNMDSTWFQKGEIENTVYADFSKENFKQKEKLGVLQNFLMSYDDTHSTLYRTGITEYEKRRTNYNRWIEKQIAQHKKTFVSKAFKFQYVPAMEWEDSLVDRVNGMIAHYFDGIDFKDTLILKTSDMIQWMNKYVNIYGAMSTTPALRDSLLSVAATIAIDKARVGGNPFVYGWMVDYFYNGFEANNIPVGIKALQPYLDDPSCYTNKKQQIEKRLNGIKKLVVGSPAPDFNIINDAGTNTQFSTYSTTCRYKLVLFWSAGCDHCKELIKNLYPWYQQISNKKAVEIFALGIDDTEADIKLWDKVHTLLKGWKHMLLKGGINSKVANAYFILSTPVMVLVDAQTNKIVALPESVEQLETAMK